MSHNEHETVMSGRQSRDSFLPLSHFRSSSPRTLRPPERGVSCHAMLVEDIMGRTLSRRSNSDN